MSRAATVAVILAPLFSQVVSTGARAEGSDALSLGGFGASWSGDAHRASPFELNPSELDPIRFSRIENPSAAEPQRVADRLTEFSFTLKPGSPDFSRSGYYGLGLLIGSPSVAVQSSLMGPNRLDATISDLNDGLAYSAGLRIEHEDESIDGTAYVSSGLLGLSYGRLGRLWYGGIDVNLEKFSDEAYGADQPDVVSLDVTTGRRLGFTGLGATAPLWLLSLEGSVDLLDEEDADTDGKPSWFLNPSLFWQHPGFTFSAQMQVPVEPVLHDEADPDYRLRAIFEKRFR